MTKNEQKLQVILDRVREQLFDPNLYTVLKQVIDESLVESYERGKSEMLSRVKNPDTTGK